MRITAILLIGVINGFKLLLGEQNFQNYQKYHSLVEQKYFPGNLTPTENRATARICGARFQPNDFIWRAKREALAKEKEYPWTVLITGPLRHCTGALISSRHVITSACCMTRRLDNKPCQNRCKDDPAYEPVRLNETFVYRLRKNPLRVRLYSVPFRVVKITINPDYNPCQIYSDLAILEISPNVFSEGLPICMPTKGEDIPESLTTTRFYRSLEARPGYYLEAINFTLDRIDGINKQLTAVSDENHCLVDIGGPLFKVSNGKHILIGITTSNKDCRWCFEYRNLFEDVRYFVDWVCQNSGVCPVKRRP